MRKHCRKILRGVVCCLIGILTTEIVLRQIGVLDFPLYESDDEIGYVLRPDQSGKYLSKNSWVINDRNMNVGEDFDGEGPNDLLLIGDSLVWGGNPIDQNDRLGEQLNSIQPDVDVWPISAPSWTTANADVWLSRNGDVLEEVEHVVWVINSGDLAQPSMWEMELTHPRSKPFSAIWQAVRKVLLPRLKQLFRQKTDKSVVDGNALIDQSTLKIFERRARSVCENGTSLFVVIYPDRAELIGEKALRENYQNFRDLVTSTLPTEAVVLDLCESPKWGSDLYRDPIHPSVAGTKVLAEIIADTAQGMVERH